MLTNNGESAHPKNILIVAKSARDCTLIGKAFTYLFHKPSIDVLIYHSNLDQFPRVSKYDIVWVEGFQPVKNNPVGVLALECEDQDKIFISRFKPNTKFSQHHKFLSKYSTHRHCSCKYLSDCSHLRYVFTTNIHDVVGQRCKYLESTSSPENGSEQKFLVAWLGRWVSAPRSPSLVNLDDLMMEDQGGDLVDPSRFTSVMPVKPSLGWHDTAILMSEGGSERDPHFLIKRRIGEGYNPPGVPRTIRLTFAAASGDQDCIIETEVTNTKSAPPRILTDGDECRKVAVPSFPTEQAEAAKKKKKAAKDAGIELQVVKRHKPIEDH